MSTTSPKEAIWPTERLFAIVHIGRLVLVLDCFVSGVAAAWWVGVCWMPIGGKARVGEGLVRACEGMVLER